MKHVLSCRHWKSNIGTDYNRTYLVHHLVFKRLVVDEDKEYRCSNANYMYLLAMIYYGNYVHINQLTTNPIIDSRLYA